MSKIEEVRSDMFKAMKAGDKETKESLSMLLAALKNKAIDKRADLTAEEEVQVILKEIKQTKEALEMTPEDRTDIIGECTRRLAVLEQYAPKMMDEKEIREYNVNQLRFKPRRKKEKKLSAKELKALEALEDRGKSKLDEGK